MVLVEFLSEVAYFTQLQIIKGNMNAVQYQDVLMSISCMTMLSLMWLGCAHSFRKLKTSTLQGPPYSPVMLPIEHLWDVQDGWPNPVLGNISELIRSLVEEWDYITRASINNLIHFM